MDPDTDPLPARRLSLARRAFPATFFILVIATCALASASASSGSPFDLSWPIWLGAIIVGLIGSALLRILDYALFALDTEELEDLSLTEPRGAEILRRLRREVDRTWLSLLSGSIFFNLMLGLGIALAMFETSGRWGGIAWPLAVAILLVLLLGDVLPGLLAARWLKQLAPRVAPLIRAADLIFRPLSIIPVAILRLAPLFGKANRQEMNRTLEVEKRLLVLVGVGQADVSLEEEEREMIDNALEFGQLTARDAMVPRGEIGGFDLSEEHEDVLQLMRKSHFSRMLVFDKSLDHVAGMVHRKQILLNPDKDFHELITPALFVTEDMGLYEVMAMMKKNGAQMVVVLDEYGSTAGILSMNDLLEELVGPGAEAAPVSGAKRL